MNVIMQVVVSVHQPKYEQSIDHTLLTNTCLYTCRCKPTNVIEHTHTHVNICCCHTCPDSPVDHVVLVMESQCHQKSHYKAKLNVAATRAVSSLSASELLILLTYWLPPYCKDPNGNSSHQSQRSPMCTNAQPKNDGRKSGS